MTHKTISLLMVAAFATLMACTGGQDKEVERITKLEDQIEATDANPDQAKLNALLGEYERFVNEHPGDTVAASYLYKSITLSISMNNAEKAITLSDRMINEFPKNRRIPEVIFLRGFVYENFLNNYAQALKNYQDFIKMFPDHDLADDAQAAIVHLGMSPDEIVREFERKAAAAEAGK